MPSYEHRRLVESVSRLNILPENADQYTDWIKAERHLDLLRTNAESDELIIYSSGEYTFIHTVVVNKSDISPIDVDDLLVWSGGPFNTCAGYVSGTRRDGVWIERDRYHLRSNSLERARRLVFLRRVSGLQETGANYFEVLQEYSHLADIHLRPEQSAYVTSMSVETGNR